MAKGKYGTGRIYQRGDVWWIEYYWFGEQRRESSHSTDRRVATKLLGTRMGEKASGKLPGLLAERITLEELAQVVEADYVMNRRATLPRLRVNFRTIKEHFGAGRPIVSMTTDRLAEFVTTMLERKYKPATVQLMLAAIQRGFNLLARAKRISRDHVPSLPTLKVENARQGFFERAVLDVLLPHLSEWSRPVAEAAYVTGWRMRSELCTREWRHVDFPNGWLRLEKGEDKNRAGRNFKLIPALRELLLAQRERVSALERELGRVIPWVFPNAHGRRIKEIHDEWTAACAAAGIPTIETDGPDIVRRYKDGRVVRFAGGTTRPARIPHDFRRTAVRNLELAGVPRTFAMQMVGHKTEAMYRRYAIVDEKALRIGGEMLARYLDAESEGGAKIEALKTSTKQAQSGEPNRSAKRG